MSSVYSERPITGEHSEAPLTPGLHPPGVYGTVKAALSVKGNSQSLQAFILKSSSCTVRKQADVCSRMSCVFILTMEVKGHVDSSSRDLWVNVSDEEELRMRWRASYFFSEMMICWVSSWRLWLLSVIRWPGRDNWVFCTLVEQHYSVTMSTRCQGQRTLQTGSWKNVKVSGLKGLLFSKCECSYQWKE